jgi:hypothetical protein
VDGITSNDWSKKQTLSDLLRRTKAICQRSKDAIQLLVELSPLRLPFLMNEQAEIEEILNLFVKSLGMNPRRRDAIIMRLFQNMSFVEMANEWGVSRARAWQIYQAGLLFCRHPERLQYFSGKEFPNLT